MAGIGPKAAIKALAQPIPVIAQAIDEGNVGLLRSLPGIGEQRAREIVAKLQGRVGKFALIQQKDEVSSRPDEGTGAMEEEAVSVLLQLEYKKSEARQMVRMARERNPKVRTSEDLLNEVYRQSRTSVVET